MHDENEMARADVVRRYCDAWLAGVTMGVLSLYHEDLTLIWPGNHPFAGRHVGQQAAIDALLAVQARTNRVPVEVVDVFAGASGAAAAVVERWTRDTDDGPEVLEHRRLLQYTVVDQRLHTCELFETVPDEVDAWLSVEAPAAG